MDQKAITRTVGVVIIAAIICAIAIAVVALTPMPPDERLRITATVRIGTSRTIVITINNTGKVPVEIDEVWINDVQQKNAVYNPSKTISTGSSSIITVPYNWTSGLYRIRLVSTNGKQFSYEFSVG
jgi:hypothetical protein